MEKKRMIVLLGKELIVREEIQIDELFKLYSDVIIRVTDTIYAIAEGHEVNGLENVVLLADGVDGNNRPTKMVCIIRGYYCPYFVGPHDYKEIEDKVWMRIVDEKGNMWIDGLMKFTERYKYLRANTYQVPFADLGFSHIEYWSMQDVPKRLANPYKAEINDQFHIPIPIV